MLRPATPDKIEAPYARLVLAAFLVYFLYLIFPYLNNDLWNDEIYTLQKFTLVHIKTTLTDYHVPNNHVLYNICDHFYLKLLHISNLRQAMEHTWILRLPLLLLSLITLILVYKTGKLAAGRAAGLISVALLVTSVPFQNFCLQVRGYGFSIFFDLLLVYACLQYVITGKRRNLFIITFSAFAAVYTIPSNLYCTLGVLAFFSVELAGQIISKRKLNVFYAKPATAVTAGILLALLCYSPVLKQVFTNQYVSNVGTPFNSNTIHTIRSILHEFVSGRVLLHLLFYVSIILYLIISIVYSQINTGKALKLLCWQFITPAVLVALRGEDPPDRVFVYLSAFTALLLAITVACVMRTLFPKILQLPLLMLLLLYLLLASLREQGNIKKTTDFDLKTENRLQGLLSDYYLHNFRPMTIVSYLQKHDPKHEIPVILKSSEPHDIPEYLTTFGIPYYKGDLLENFLSSNKRIFVITLFPHEYDSTFSVTHHCLIREITPPSYHHLIELDAR